MTMRRIALLIPMLSMIACGGQVSMPGSSTRSDIDELQARVLELQRRAAVTEVELRELRDEVGRLKGPRASATPPPPSAPKEPEADVGWEPPVQTVEIETSDLPPSEPPAPVSGSDAEDMMPVPPPSSEAQALYDRGYTLYHQGRYEDAEKIFREMLGTYRKNELSDNAWYWIGESRWARADVNGALDAFRETLENYPGGNKTPDALLKMGQCLERLGDPQSAREAYRQLIDRYPATAAAAVAEDRLASGQ